MSNPKRAILSGYYGFDNFGDEAILNVLATNLKSNNIDVTVISKNPDKTAKTLSVNSVYTFSIPDILKGLKKSDVLISGGGSLLQDATSFKSLLYYLFIIMAAQIYKKKVIIFAQGIGPIRNPIGKLLTKNLLKKCSYVSVRDEKSLFRVRGWGINAELVNDPVWSVKTIPAIKMDRIGIQLRSWKNLSGKYLFSLARLIALNFPEKEIYIYSFQDSLDYEICKSFEGSLKLSSPNIKTKIIKAESVQETIQSVSNLDYMIAMRYHACLLALKYGIKTLALSYDEKVEKLAARFNIPCSNLQDEDSLPSKIEAMKNLNSQQLLSMAEDLEFDFTKIIEVINR